MAPPFFGDRIDGSPYLFDGADAWDGLPSSNKGGEE
jgi:hypothetical protein